MWYCGTVVLCNGPSVLLDVFVRFFVVSALLPREEKRTAAKAKTRNNIQDHDYAIFFFFR